MNVTTATPVEIDTRLAQIMGEQIDASTTAGQAADTIYWYAEGRRSFRGRGNRPAYSLDEAIAKAREVTPSYDQRSIDRAVERLTQARETLVRLRNEAAPLNAEYDRRPWTRAFLAVTNGGGHVHRSMGCSTCFLDRYDDVTGEFKQGTAFAWMTEYSGKDEAEIVADAGERACTVCYPSAPAETLNRPTKMFSQGERDAAKAREEREAKRAAKAAAQITLTVHATRGRYDGPVTRQEVTWKTVRALQNDTGALVRSLAGTYAMINGFNLDFYRIEERPDGTRARVDANREEGLDNLRTMLAALSERGVDADAVLTKNYKRAVKDGGGRTWNGEL